MRGSGTGEGPATFVAYSERTNRLSYLSSDLKVLGRQTQLKSPPSAMASLGSRVAVGYHDAQISLVDVVSGALAITGRVNPSGLGPTASDVFLDGMLATPTRLLVQGQYSSGKGELLDGYVQELDVRTLTAKRSFTFPGKFVQDLRWDASGKPLGLLDDGSVVDLSRGAAVRWHRPEKPAYFLPLRDGRVVTATRGKTPTLFAADGRQLPLDASLMALVDLGNAGYAVLLSDGVLGVDATGNQTRISVPKVPYSAVFRDGHLLVGPANGDQVTDVAASPFAVRGTATVDWGVDFLLAVA